MGYGGIEDFGRVEPLQDLLGIDRGAGEADGISLVGSYAALPDYDPKALLESGELVVLFAKLEAGLGRLRGRLDVAKPQRDEPAGPPDPLTAASSWTGS